MGPAQLAQATASCRCDMEISTLRCLYRTPRKRVDTAGEEVQLLMPEDGEHHERRAPLTVWQRMMSTFKL